MFTAFISDLHLSPERPRTTDIFLRFLEGDATRADALYILGDLFDHWAGDDTLDDPFNGHIARALKAFTSRGIPTYFMHGNRDFLLRKRFARVAGIQLLKDPTVIDLYGTRTVLMHGDTMCTEDVRYQQFRAKVRHPINLRLILALPKFMRLRLARRARRRSEEEKPGKRDDILDVTPSAVEEAFRVNACQRMIHGHTHRPAHHQVTVDGQSCERWVLADWFQQGQYLRCSPTEWQSIQLD